MKGDVDGPPDQEADQEEDQRHNVLILFLTRSRSKLAPSPAVISIKMELRT